MNMTVIVRIFSTVVARTILRNELTNDCSGTYHATVSDRTTIRGGRRQKTINIQITFGSLGIIIACMSWGDMDLQINRLFEPGNSL
jgi:hypothetical protein